MQTPSDRCCRKGHAKVAVSNTDFDSMTTQKRKPARLCPGDTIGVAAPAGPVERDGLERGVAILQKRGYRVALGEHVLDTLPEYSYLAGRDADRAADLNALFADDTIDAIFCARGGYGSARLLPLLDWERIAAHPKLFVGFSDITSLHSALAVRANLITIHGKMLTTLDRLDALSSEVFWRLLEEPTPLGLLPTPDAEIQTVVAGTAVGALAGGCLCLLAHACGTPDAPDFRDKIVVLEDVGEAVYRADRDLIQLRNAGHLEQAAGFIVGTITNWKQQEATPPQNTPDTIWADILAPLGKPLITGFPFGHEPNPLSLPLGVQAELDATSGQVRLLESATQ